MPSAINSVGRGALRLLSVLAIICAASPAAGQSFATEYGMAEFTSSVPLHTFKGRSENLVGMINLADSTVDFYLDLTTLKTGIGKRDKDMRLTLNTEDFPFAEFFGKLVSTHDLSITGPQRAVVNGTFSIHGVSRSVEIIGTLAFGGDEVRLQADWEMNLEDYEITPPRLLIVKVDEIQKVRIEATLIRGTLQ